MHIVSKNKNKISKYLFSSFLGQRPFEDWQSIVKFQIEVTIGCIGIYNWDKSF